MAQRCTDVASCHLLGEALTTAATNRKFDVMKALLESTSEFDLEELAGTLNSVCAWESEEASQLLLKHDEKKLLGIKQYSGGLSQAALNKNRQVVVYWLEGYPENHDLVVDPATVIDVAGNGFMDILPPLVERIRPTASYKRTLSQCLQVASMNGHVEVVEYLIGESANINAVGGEVRLSSLQAALMGFERFDPKSHLTRLRSS